MVKTPRPFQALAIEKLTKQTKNGSLLRSRLIGDDMGLGKTLEAVEIDLKLRRDDTSSTLRTKRTLIIAPLTVVISDSWREHILDQNPKARVVVCDPKNRAKFIKALSEPFDYYIVHYAGARIMAKELAKVNWFHVIADECQEIKNRKAAVSIAVKNLPAIYRSALSGTPADDKPQDLWHILHWLWPGYYTSYWKFVGHYTVQGTKTFTVRNGTGDLVERSVKTFVGVQNTASLHKEMSGFFVRRHKEEVLDDLPPTVPQDYWVDLTPVQRKAYEQMKNDMIAWVEEKQADGESLDNPVIATAAISRLVRLQQFAIAMLTYNTEAMNDWEARVEAHNEVWKRWKDNGEQGTEPKKPRMPSPYIMSEPSSKLDAVMQILSETDRQVIVWSSFRQPIELLANRLRDNDIPHGLITGTVTGRDRFEAINDFQSGKNRVIAGTIAAGGVGINLTAASEMIFIDRSWKPTANKQAIDRAHRIGQKNSVHVIDIMARNTVDLGRRVTLMNKWEQIKQILGDK